MGRSPYLRRGAWIAGVLFVLFVMVRWDSHSYPHDFFELWACSEGIRTMDIGNIYTAAPEIDHEMRRRFHRDPDAPRSRFDHSDGVAPFNITFTPLLIAWTKAMSVGNLETDWHRYRRSAMIALGLGFLAFAWAVNAPVFLALPGLYVFTRMSWAFWVGLVVGNFDILQTGLLMAALALLKWRRRDTFAACGFMLAFLALAKPTLAFALPFFLLSLALDRRWTDVAAVAAGAAAAGVVALAFDWYEIGFSASWLAWGGSVPGSFESKISVRSWTFASEMTGTNSIFLHRTVGPVLLSGSAVWFWYTRKRQPTLRHSIARDAGAASVGALLYLMTGPLVHTHYFLQALPAGLVLMRLPRHGERLPVERWAIAFVACFMCGGQRYFARWGWVPASDNFSALTYLGVLILFIMLLIDRRALASSSWAAASSASDSVDGIEKT